LRDAVADLASIMKSMTINDESLTSEVKSMRIEQKEISSRLPSIRIAIDLTLTNASEKTKESAYVEALQMLNIETLVPSQE
jgi:hypothetical protein